MKDPELQSIVDFVEGRTTPDAFVHELHDVPKFEALLSDDPSLRANTYIGTSTYLYILEQDLKDPGGVLNVQHALSEWPERHGIDHQPSEKFDKLHSILLDAQPKWLDVDTKYLQSRYLSRAGERSGKALRQWLRLELRREFRYVAKPPSWIQSPQWPIGANGPLVFLGQMRVRHYFHDDAAVYVFHDPDKDQYQTVVQVA